MSCFNIVSYSYDDYNNPRDTSYTYLSEIQHKTYLEKYKAYKNIDNVNSVHDYTTVLPFSQEYKYRPENVRYWVNGYMSQSRRGIMEGEPFIIPRNQYNPLNYISSSKRVISDFV